MRNPIRLKNLRWRFLPLYAVGILLLLATRPSKSAYLCGSSVVLVGAAVRAWGAGHLVKTERLTFTGPYAFVRHPLYAGTLLVGVGLAVAAGSWLSLCVLVGFLAWFCLAYFPRKERVESARLEARYGAAFTEYRANVPALIPRLAPWSPSPGTLACGDPKLRWSLERYSENNELGTLLGLFACLVAFGLRAWMVI